ncbi:MAG: ABC transporter permease [Prevotella sp.]|nr:ABC transporter permease [Prevotella sp.]
MNCELYIARRYLFSKKSTNVINVISGISIAGVTVATMAMVVVLSVFNGFSDLVATFFTSFDPQLKVVATEGKTFAADAPEIVQIKAMEEVEMTSETVEDQALAVYADRQAMVIVKGVDDNFARLTNIRNICYGEGDFTLHAADLQYGVMGIRLASAMGVGAYYPGYVHIYAPQREGQLDMMNPMTGFVVDSLLSPGVIFCVQQSRYDSNYILTSLPFARMLFQCDGEITSLEVRLKPGTDITMAKEKIQSAVGSKYKVKDRYEQQEETFNIMKIEKLMAYVFLTFILVVACFNIIGSLSMLIIDKKNDVQTLRSLGARESLIRRIFTLEGWMISIIGATLGVALGLLLCWLQQQYGIVSLGQSAGAFIIEAYPVSVHYDDVAIIYLTVVAIGLLAVLYPVRYALKRS